MQLNGKSVIAFDLGYTLVTNDRVNHYHSYAQSKGITLNVSEITKAFHAVDKIFMREYRKVISHGWNQHFPWFVGNVNHILHQTFDIIEQTNYMKEQREQDPEPYWKVFPWTHDVLTTLKDNSYRLALLSNWDKSARYFLDHLKLTPYFETCIISDEFGCEKPDPRIFHELITKMRMPAEEIVYVGDNYYDDVVGAKQAEIDTILLNPFEKQGIEELDHNYIVPDTRSLVDLFVHNQWREFSHASRS
ncbi:HAD family hydrolase [Evansella sp. AB-rgal1]|uniref:HAD family hydrolase n=1 Tax=Evansella sp. AB-rgal1 TaxID=3242696 RepID=UPI00359E5658